MTSEASALRAATEVPSRCGFVKRSGALAGGTALAGLPIHGAKCGAQFSGKIHAATTRMYRDQRFASDNIAWEAAPEKISPWQAEWNVFLHAIRNDRRHNEARQAALSQLADLMGRAAIHMGRVITFDEVMASNFEWVPGGLDNFNENSPPPVVADANGRYPVPVPGQWVEV